MNEWDGLLVGQSAIPAPSFFLINLSRKLFEFFDRVWISEAGQRRNNAPFKKPSGKGKPRTKQPKKVKFISEYLDNWASFEWCQRNAYSPSDRIASISLENPRTFSLNIPEKNSKIDLTKIVCVIDYHYYWRYIYFFIMRN